MKEALNLLQEKGSKDAFNKKCCIDETRFAMMTPASDLLLLTTFSVGLQLIQWDNQLPISCLSTPTNISWHCPAVYLKDENAFVGIPKGKEFNIFKWNCGDKFNDSIMAKKLDNGLIPFKIWNFFNSGIIIGYKTGKFEILDGILNTVLEIDSGLVEEILFMDYQCSKNDYKLVIVGVPIGKKDQLQLSLVHYERDKTGQSVLVSNISFEILDFKSFKNLGFSFDGRHLGIIDESFKVTTFNIRSNSIDKVSHDLSSKLKGAKLLSFKLITNNHFALLCAVQSGGRSTAQVSVWENRFGTLQSIINLDMVTLSEKFNRTQGFLNGFYDASGYFLTISLSCLGSSNVEISHLLLPVNVETISLKSVLGKLTSKSQGSCQIAALQFNNNETPILSQNCIELNNLNGEKLTLLLSQKSLDKFEDVFTKWVSSNLELVSKHKNISVPDQKKNLEHKRSVLISQKQIKEIAAACFENQLGMWPRSVIKYCLENHLFYSNIIDSGLVEKIIKNNDIELLWVAIHNLLDISENDWSRIIRYVLSLKDTMELDVLVSKAIEKETSNAHLGICLSHGQEYICNLAFSAPRNYHLMIRALSHLEENEVEKLLNWIRQVVQMKDERFMWWAWGEVGTNLSQKSLQNLFKRRQMALDALSLLVDSHLILVSTSSKLIEILQEIRTHVKRECEFATQFQNRIFGMLKQFRKEVDAPLGQKKSAGGRRWQKMLDQLHDNTGSYCVEVLKF